MIEPEPVNISDHGPILRLVVFIISPLFFLFGAAHGDRRCLVSMENKKGQFQAFANQACCRARTEASLSPTNSAYTPGAVAPSVLIKRIRD